MAITTTQHESTRINSTVAVRVPENSDADLVTAAENRLNSVDAIRSAQVDGFQAIDPRLSATVVTVTASLEPRASVDDVREGLSDTVAIEEIKSLG